jgi:tRNA (adenine57-N1/adenine58-N1)-methyltransferase
MYETLLRPHEVHTVPALQTIQEVGRKLKQAEEKREAKRLKQVAASSALRENKRKRENGIEESNSTPHSDITPTNLSSPAPKRTRAGDGCHVELLEDTPARENLEGTTNALPPTGEATPSTAEDEDTVMSEDPREQGAPEWIAAEDFSTPTPQRVVSKVMQEVRGHTSYLTFAVLLPSTGTSADVLSQKLPGDGVALDVDSATS